MSTYIENEWINFDEYTITIEENECEENDVKDLLGW